MSTKKTIKTLAKKIEKLIPCKPVKVLIKNYSIDKGENVLVMPIELIEKYGIKTEN